MLDWAIWGGLLILQQAAQTASSRAKNSSNLIYTLIASIFSNGVWFSSQFYIVNTLIAAKGNPGKFAMTLAFYIVFTVLGTTGMQWFLIGFEKRRGIT